MSRKSMVVPLLALGATVLAGCGGAAKTSTAGGDGASKVAGATSAADAGGMDALVAAAKKEGVLNAITLPRNWANYGAIMDSFSKKYGIRINDANPDGSSQDEINAVKQLKGQDRAPDVLDLGSSFAISAAQDKILAPYKVATWDQIPANQKATDGSWFNDYGGFVAIGYDSAKVKTPPTSFADLTKPEFKNSVAISGNPAQSGAAFAAVYAAALANGGSFDNIQPGIDYFAKLKKVGNFVPVTGSAATVQSGQTPVLVKWDYLLASEVQGKLPSFKVTIPRDAHFASYYAQAINKAAPHPAAARLWEEYLYSTEGQNLWLQGKARPVNLDSLVKAGTVDQAAYKTLPPAPQGVDFPNTEQQTKAKSTVSQKWATATRG